MKELSEKTPVTIGLLVVMIAAIVYLTSWANQTQANTDMIKEMRAQRAEDSRTIGDIQRAVLRIEVKLEGEKNGKSH
jgi:Tfp pilus assembly protein PilW